MVEVRLADCAGKADRCIFLRDVNELYLYENEKIMSITPYFFLKNSSGLIFRKPLIVVGIGKQSPLSAACSILRIGTNGFFSKKSSSLGPNWNSMVISLTFSFVLLYCSRHAPGNLPAGLLYSLFLLQ